MKERQKFIEEMLRHDMHFNALCEKYNISEKTGHKWKNRFMAEGFSGLCDQSKAPKKTVGLTEDVVIRVIALKTAHPTWGAKKLDVLYRKAYKDGSAPSVSSIQRVVGKAGLVRKRRIKKVTPCCGNRLRQYIQAEEANDVWTVDFKGWWYSSREKCVPLTIRDLKSKYLLEIKLMQSCSSEAVKEVFEQVFRKYGLPKVIRSDNGTPFASPNGRLNLTNLSVWWISLGVLPDRTDKGCPGQNGSHERMHADLAMEIQGKIPGGIIANQAAIDAWREEYNNVRPNEAIGMATPAEIYTPSERMYEGDFDTFEYPLGFMARKVFRNGEIVINSQRLALSCSLRGFTVGLCPNENNCLTVFIAEFPLGEIDLNTYCFYPFESLE